MRLLLLTFLLQTSILQAQTLSFLARYGQWNQRNDLPGSVSGIDWSESERKVYFVSDQKDKVYSVGLEIAKTEAGYCVEVGSAIKTYSLRGIDEDSNLESIRVLDNGEVYLSAERGDESLETFLYRGKIESGNDIVNIDPVTLPENFKRTFSGNSGIEGISCSEGQPGLWIINERNFQGDPLYRVSLTHLNPDGSFQAFAYILDPVGEDNGVSELLEIGSSRLLALERCYLGNNKLSVRVIGVTIDEWNKVTKEELFQIDKALSIDANFEGMSWGPTLPNHHRTLLLIADDNRDWNTCRQETELVVLEVLNLNSAK